MELLLLRETYDGEAAGASVVGRTITLRLATLNRVYEHHDKDGRTMRERVLPGAFREPLARPHGVLRFRHEGEKPDDRDGLDKIHGVMTALREQGEQVLADFEVFPGADGDKLLRIVNSGAITGSSISAIIRGVKVTRDARGPLIDITRISEVNGASITPKPAWDDAGVLAVREAAPPDPADQGRRAEAIAAERARLDRAKELLNGLP